MRTFRVSAISDRQPFGSFVILTAMDDPDLAKTAVRYDEWLQRTRTNPQVGDLVDLDENGQILGLAVGAV